METCTFYEESIFVSSLQITVFSSYILLCTVLCGELSLGGSGGGGTDGGGGCGEGAAALVSPLLVTALPPPPLS